MPTMTIPSANMRRLKQAAAAARASQGAAPAPVLRRRAGDGGGDARGPAGRVHRTSPYSGKRHTTVGGGNNGRDNMRASRPTPPAQGSSSSSLGKSRATTPPKPPSAPSAAAAHGGNAAKVGDRVIVQTPVTHTAAGQHVLMTIGAVVVSVAEEDGDMYFEVFLDGNYPPHDPSSTVRVTMDEIVRTTPAAATKPSPSVAPTSVPGPERPSKRNVVGSVTSLRGAERQTTSLQNARGKRSRY